MSQRNDQLMTHTLSRPAWEWVDGHVLGNGDVGAVVWGHPGQISVGLSKHDVNDLRGACAKDGWNATYKDLRQMAIAGHRNFDELLSPPRGAAFKGPFPVSCGRLSLELFRGVQMVGYEQTLDMRTAECRCVCRPTPSAKNWGMAYAPIEVTVYTHAKRNLVAVELRCEMEQRAAWRFDYSPGTELPELPTYSILDGRGIGIAQHNLPESESYAVAISVDGAGSKTTATSLGFTGHVGLGGTAGPARILLGVASGRDADRGATASDVAIRQIETATALSLDELRHPHRHWWETFWSKSEIDYEIEDVARFWCFGVYALASSTRPGKSPPHLQGIWNQYDVPPWHADFHFNTNLQECHWIACPSNHPELQESLVRVLTKDWRESHRAIAAAVYAAPGLAVPLCGDWRGRAIGWGGLSVELGMTAWMAQHLWKQWLFTRDISLLKNDVHPYLAECVEFYRSVLHQREDGLWHVELSHSPEQVAVDKDGRHYFGFGSDPTIDLVFIKALLEAYVDASAILGIDEPLVAEAKAMAERLPEPATMNGVLIDCAVGFFREGDAPGRFPVSHRHPSRLVGIFPGDEIGLHSPPDTLELGRRSFREFLSYGDEGFTGWSMAWQAAIAARLGLADEAEERLSVLGRYFTLAGLLNSHNSVDESYGHPGGALFQLEGSLGAAAAVNEMLLQSSHGFIRVFPGLPERRAASFRKLRVEGALLVSAEKVKEGVLCVEITAEADGEFTRATPWPGKRIKSLTKGSARVIDEDGLRMNVAAGTTVRFTCEKE